MSKNLVIGNTSQLSKYFPDDYEKISSRNIDVDFITSYNWQNIYICFAEQKTYLPHLEDNIFQEINYNYTLNLINKIKNYSNRIVYYSTTELWNNIHGPINIYTPYSFKSSQYILSKYDTTYALKDKNIYKNVCIGYPFNFNSIYRSKEFLFGKIFDSIKNKTQIFLKDINYYREMIHPSMVVAESIKNSDNFNDFIIGSGRVIFIYDFIKKLYDKFNMDFKKYVVIDRQDSSMYRKNIYYNDTYNELYTEKYLFDIITKELEQ